jgi:phytoene dehydrogenase-like protein
LEVHVAADKITVVGGGIGGLVAAIVCAQHDRQVVLHEATGKLGGRARSSEGPHVANYGPHALYGNGQFYAWLRREKLLPKVAMPIAPTMRARLDGRITRLPQPLISAALRLRGDAPVDLDYRTWAEQHASEPVVQAAIGFVSLPTFHHDPGELSAAFCHERFRRLILGGHRVRYVIGGWSVLVDALAQRARDLGVHIQTESSVSELPRPPVILALPLKAAGRLLGQELQTQGARTVLLDVAIRAKRRSPRIVFDLTERIYLTRTTGPDPSLAPAGEDLIQTSTGLRPGETLAQATARIEAAMDDGFPGWREGETWRRRSLAENSSGAVDPPGSTWRDRPPIKQDDGVYLVGDMVAAPGLLSEVAQHSALHAAQLATA